MRCGLSRPSTLNFTVSPEPDAAGNQQILIYGIPFHSSQSFLTNFFKKYDMKVKEDIRKLKNLNEGPKKGGKKRLNFRLNDNE